MWAKVDDGWWCHPKVMGLSLAARGLWVSALSWSCQQRRPEVPTHFLGMVGAPFELADEIASAGLWIATGNGWEIHDWAEYQDRSVAEKRAEAGRRGGQRSGEARRSKAKQKQAVTSGNDEANRSTDEANAEAGTHPVPTHPNPVVPTSTIAVTEVVEPSAAATVDEQTIRKTAVAIGRAEAWTDPAGVANPEGYAQSVTRQILTAPDRSGERDRIRTELAAGRSPEQIAEGWRTLSAPVQSPEVQAEIRARAKRAEEATRARLEAAGAPADRSDGLAAVRAIREARSAS